MSETARELGFDLSVDELEKIFVSAQEPDENELRVVAGGDLEENHPEDEPDYDPYEGLTKYEKDALLYDLDTNCYFDHWCVMTFLHTETDRTDVECFKNYDCVWFSN